MLPRCFIRNPKISTRLVLVSHSKNIENGHTKLTGRVRTYLGGRPRYRRGEEGARTWAQYPSLLCFPRPGEKRNSDHWKVREHLDASPASVPRHLQLPSPTNWERYWSSSVDTRTPRLSRPTSKPLIFKSSPPKSLVCLLNHGSYDQVPLWVACGESLDYNESDINSIYDPAEWLPKQSLNPSMRSIDGSSTEYRNLSGPTLGLELLTHLDPKSTEPELILAHPWLFWRINSMLIRRNQIFHRRFQVPY